MPVLINAETGLAEDLPEQSANEAVVSGTHHVPLVDPQGNPSAAPMSDASALLTQGYKQPSPDQLKGLLDYSKYSSPAEQAKTFLEGAGEAATFGLSTGAERALGVNPEDIRARKEVNPGVHQVGQLVGLTGSAFIPGVGEANILSEAGNVAAKALGLSAGEGILAKVGSAAARGAVETALYQAGDEASKMFAGDPNQSAQTAIADIGLGALLGAGVGGAFGSISPLWKATQEYPMGKLLNAVKSKANGLEPGIIPPSIDSAIEASGMAIPDEMRAALSSDAELRGAFQTLQESTTQSGKKAQEAFAQFRNQTRDALLRAVNRTPEQIESLSEHSLYDQGIKIQSSLVDEIKKITDPLAEQFGKIKERFSKAELPAEEAAGLTNELNSINQKYGVSPSSSEFQKISTIIKELPNVKSLEDLRNFQAVHLGDIANKHLWSISTPVRQAFRDAEENVILKQLGEQAPELIEQHKAARVAYRAVMEDLDALNDRLHVGRYSGPDTFLHALKEMSPEDVLRRLSPKNDVGIMQLVAQKFPGSAQLVRENYLSQLLKAASKSAKGDEIIRASALFSELDKLSPELRRSLLPEESLNKINSVRTLIEAVPQKMNPSGTAKTLDALWGQLPGGVGGLVSLLMGHSPVTGYLTGQAARIAAREVPDAARLALLRFLGSNKPINSPAFKAMVDFASSMIKGEALTAKAIKALFKSGVDVAPQVIWPDDKSRKKLDKRLTEVQRDISSLMNVGGDTGYYMEGHATALASTAVRAVQYLNSLRPNVAPQAPLDGASVPSTAQTAKYTRALDIAEQPLVVLKSIKQGNLTAEDVTTLRTIYPDFYARVSQKLYEKIIEHGAQGNMIPYRTRLSMGLFLGQDLDSTMKPQSILAAQPKNGAQQQPSQAQGPATPAKAKGSMKSLNEMSAMYQTPQQARAAQKLSNA